MSMASEGLRQFGLRLGRTEGERLRAEATEILAAAVACLLCLLSGRLELAA